MRGRYRSVIRRKGRCVKTAPQECARMGMRQECSDYARQEEDDTGITIRAGRNGGQPTSRLDARQK